MTPRRASKTDTNQAEIVEALRAAGASVECLHAVGEGVPDLLIGFGREVWYSEGEQNEEINILMEVKSDTGKLTPDQIEWHDAWPGQVAIVRSVEEALRVIGKVE